MVRVFYTQKTEQLLKKMELTQWREMVQQELEQKHQDLSDNWKTCAIGERIRKEGIDLKNIKDLSPEAIRLGYDFSVALQERNNDAALEILTKIENLQTIWRHEV
jgi:NOL1/NOP2/fmu family ribosome biogenesis protein